MIDQADIITIIVVGVAILVFFSIVFIVNPNSPDYQASCTPEPDVPEHRETPDDILITRCRLLLEALRPEIAEKLALHELSYGRSTDRNRQESETMECLIDSVDETIRAIRTSGR